MTLSIQSPSKKIAHELTDDTLNPTAEEPPGSTPPYDMVKDSQDLLDPSFLGKTEQQIRESTNYILERLQLFAAHKIKVPDQSISIDELVDIKLAKH